MGHEEKSRGHVLCNRETKIELEQCHYRILRVYLPLELYATPPLKMSLLLATCVDFKVYQAR